MKSLSPLLPAIATAIEAAHLKNPIASKVRDRVTMPTNAKAASHIFLKASKES